MQAIKLLEVNLALCDLCQAAFRENIGMIIDDSSQLTEEQAQDALDYFAELHEKHTRVM